MAQGRSAVLSQLAALTGDLTNVSGAPSGGELHQARITLASALASPEASVIDSQPANAAPLTDFLPETVLNQLRNAVAESSQGLSATAGDSFTIVRRTVPLAVPGIASLTPDAIAGQTPDLTLGPFADPVGRPVWIDLFRIIRQVNLVRTAGGTPFLTVPVSGPLIPGKNLRLGAGSVWIASQSLAASAPAGGFTGLLIHGGKLRFSSPVPHSGLEIVVPASVRCTLALDLNPGIPPVGTGPGDDARVCVADLPTSATFTFSSSGAVLSSVSSANARIYGCAVDFTIASGSATFDAVTAQILYPATTPESVFTIRDVRSSQFQPAGSADIDHVGWALPVAITSATSLGTASGAGSLAIFTKTGLTAAWTGQNNPLPITNASLLVSPGLITVAAVNVLGLGTRQTIPLWSAVPGGLATSQVTLTWAAPFALRYSSSSAGVEILVLPAACDGNFDRPLTVNGHRVYVHSDLLLCLFVESALITGFLIEGLLQSPAVNPTSPLAFAIENAVFRTTPATDMILVGLQNAAGLDRVGLSLGFGLQFTLPTLPDPYAANFVIANQRTLDEAGSAGIITAIVQWTAAGAPTLTYQLPSSASAFPALLTAAPAKALQKTEADFSSVGPRSGILLLDVSTNVDQFGVAWTNNRTEGTGSLTVDSMFLATSSNSMAVFTVPAVQWEAVYTEPTPDPADPTGFPSPMSFATNGGPSAISVQTANLVQLAPAPALDALVGNFTTSTAPAAAIAQLTLPFGIVASANLNKPSGPGSAGATVDYIRPSFSAQSVMGGYQISLRAVDPLFPDYPAFQGSTTQLENGLFNGVSTGKSVLGPDVDAIFNPYLGPGGTRPMVPVTRLDLSGYGESLFSDWRNETSDITAVSKARFDVLIGRTAVEVVQVRSILYPYGVRVVRTITIQRKNTGVVARHDSGWQAASDGEYAFGGTLTVHSGEVLKMVDVINIRDTGQFADADGVQVAGVYFDGALVIDGVTKGAGVDGVPAPNQIGYVQLTPESSGGPLTPAQYQQLIQNVGPMGGTVDCTIDIAGSGLAMRIGRVGVGVTQGMGGPEFVMCAWGSPQFPTGAGQWSFLQQTAAGGAPQLLDSDLGVPLIRSGAAPTPPPSSSAYRFADPVDLATPANPLTDYGIVHATGTQRVFFPRPKIEATAPFQITSTVAPTLADPYSLANSVGLFPRTDAAIPFPDANYSLAISAAGDLKLQMPSPSFPVTVGQRTISQASDVRAYADYSAAVVTIAIDTASAVPWSFQLKNSAAAMSSSSMGEVMRLVGDFNADAKNASTLSNSNVIFGGALGVVQDVMKFLQELGLPTPMSVSMTNSPELKIGLKIPLDDELNKLMPPCGPSFQDTDVTVGWTIDLISGDVGAEFELSAAIFIPTPFCTCVPAVPPEEPTITGLQGVGLIAVDAKLDTSFGQVITLTLGAGIGVTFKLADSFKVVAYYVETEFLIFGDVLGLGVGALLKGTIDLEVIEVDVSVEAKMAVLKVDESSTCSAVTVWAAAQVTFAVDVTIAWVIDIDFEVQTEWSRNLNGGPCALPDVL
jgi:hypothetical protein